MPPTPTPSPLSDGDDPPPMIVTDPPSLIGRRSIPLTEPVRPIRPCHARLQIKTFSISGDEEGCGRPSVNRDLLRAFRARGDSVKTLHQAMSGCNQWMVYSMTEEGRPDSQGTAHSCLRYWPGLLVTVDTCLCYWPGLLVTVDTCLCYGRHQNSGDFLQRVTSIGWQGFAAQLHPYHM